MLKESIICIIIIIAIIFGNYVTQNYTKETITEISENLISLRDEITKEEEQEKKSEKIEEINKQWEERHDKLAYFLEHNELEKIETNLTELKSYIETEELPDMVSHIDKTVFLLRHMEDKYAFNLQNIF